MNDPQKTLADISELVNYTIAQIEDGNYNTNDMLDKFKKIQNMLKKLGFPTVNKYD